MSLQGKCNCGAIRVTVSGSPQVNALCSCTSCRASTGSIFSVNLVVQSKDLTIDGEDNVTEYRDTNTDSGHTAVRRFCKTCGSPIETVVAENPDTHFVKGGLFPPKSLPKPNVELFSRNWEEWQDKHHPDAKVLPGDVPAQ
ncbi:hypothetical protein JCM6882_007676 [Rhodosporidiobolus microsporus]